MGDYEVVEIVDFRRSSGHREFKVKWADSWVKERNLAGCHLMIQRFFARNKDVAKDNDESTADPTITTTVDGANEDIADDQQLVGNYVADNCSEVETEDNADTQSEPEANEDDDKEDWEPNKKKSKKIRASNGKKEPQPKAKPKKNKKKAAEPKKPSDTEEANGSNTKTKDKKKFGKFVPPLKNK